MRPGCTGVCDKQAHRPLPTPCNLACGFYTVLRTQSFEPLPDQHSRRARLRQERVRAQAGVRLYYVERHKLHSLAALIQLAVLRTDLGQLGENLRSAWQDGPSQAPPDL